MIIAVVCGVLAVALGLVFAGDRGPSGADDAVSSLVDGLPAGVLHALVLPTEPYVLLPVLALLIFWCLHGKRPGDAVFVALAPAVAVVVSTWVLKPLFDRWKGDGLVYPSGHTVSMVATLVVIFLLVRAKAATAVVGAVLLAGATVGMVGLGYHYVTDVVGGALFAVFAVVVVRRFSR